MSFVLTGIVFVLALIAGCISHCLIIRYECIDENENTEESYLAIRDNLAKAITRLRDKNNWRQTALVVVAALLCAATTFKIWDAGVEWIQCIRYMILAVLLMMAMLVDWNTHKIPNLIVGLILLLGIVLLVIEFFCDKNDFVTSFVMYGVGILACFFLFYIMSKLTNEGMGMGDIKLIAVMGWNMGLSLTLFVVLIALVLSSVMAMFLLFGKKKNKKEQFPFGPFLFFGYILMMLFIYF